MTLSKREKFLLWLLSFVVVSAVVLVFVITPLYSKLSVRKAELEFKEQEYIVLTQQVENYEKNKSDAKENKSREQQLTAQLSDVKTPEQAENNVVGLFESKGIAVNSAAIEYLKLNNSVGYYKIEVTAKATLEKLLEVQDVVNESEYLTLPSLEYRPRDEQGEINTTAVVCVYVKEGE
ncbi:MAG: hypothetical protein RRY40_05025 [Oscillospiraceae bacterium]